VHVALDARLADYAAGGIANYTLSLAAALGRLQPPERLTLLRSARPKIAAERLKGLASARLFTPPHHRLERLTLAAEVARLRPQVLHSPDFIPPHSLGWKRVVTVHDLAFIYFPETLTATSRRYYGQIEQAVREADAVIAVSEHTRADLLRLTGVQPAKITVVLEAADPRCRPVQSPAKLQAARARLGLAQQPFVLFVGSLEPRKNLLRLLQSFERVRRQTDVALVLVARSGWLNEPIFRQLERPELRASVRLVQDARGDELASFYSAAAVLALPSLYEGFGLPALEAMACGCPVVASNRGALPEVVGQAAVLVDAEDVEGLAQALLRVLGDDSLRADLARRGLSRSQQFSWDRAARETLELYRRVAA
jgi:glycosyltransferase involved in cell wall biosynthesis